MVMGMFAKDRDGEAHSVLKKDFARNSLFDRNIIKEIFGHACLASDLEPGNKFSAVATTKK